MSESTFYIQNNNGEKYVEHRNPSSILTNLHYLEYKTEQEDYNIQIASPVFAEIESIEIKDVGNRNQRPVFITIHFTDGSILLGFFMNSGKYREDREDYSRYFTHYDYLDYYDTHVFHFKPEEGKTIDFFQVVNENSSCFYEEYCWIFMSGGVVSLLKVDERTLPNIIHHYPMLYRPNDYISIFTIDELDFSERFGEVVGSCRINASGKPVKIICDFRDESVELEIFEANYEPEQDGEIDGISCREYREAELREV